MHDAAVAEQDEYCRENKIWYEQVITPEVVEYVRGNQEVLAGAGDRTAAGLSVRGGGRLRWRVELTAGLGGSAEDLSAAFGVSLGTGGQRTSGRSR